MGPFTEDATPIQFAVLLAREVGGFQPPPGYLNGGLAHEAATRSKGL
jgi:hypothetical protein